MEEEATIKAEEKAEAEVVAVANEEVEAEEPTVEPEAEKAEEEPVEKPVENTEEVAENGEETITIEKEPEMDNEVAKSLVKEASQKSISESADYLKSKSAVADFAKIMYKSSKTGAGIDLWKENLAAKGITGDALLPSRIENVLFKAWEDKGGILSTFRTSTARHLAANAFYGANAEDIRAKGHKKGEAKAEQIITNKRRDLSVKAIYKMLNLDWQDIVEDENGELLAFRTEELAARVADEIAKGAILGDGRTAPEGSDPDYRVFDGTRGLFSMVADIDGSTVANSYASFVASQIANVETDTIYAKIVKTLNAVKPVTTGGRKVLIVPEGTIAELQLIQNENGGYLFQPGTDFAAIFNALVFELPGVKAAGYDVLAYADQGYVLTGTGDVVRTGYDMIHNQDQMLVERAVAGSLEGWKRAAGYKSAAVSA